MGLNSRFKAIVKEKIPMIAADDVPVGAVVDVYNVLPRRDQTPIAYFWWGNQRGYCGLELLEEI